MRDFKALFFLMVSTVLLATSHVAAETASIGAPVSSSFNNILRDIIYPPENTVKIESVMPLEVQLGSVEFTNLQGNQVTKDDLGEKKVVLYFWSVYCHGCIDGLRELEDLRDEFARANTELMTVHLFEPKTERLVGLLDKMGLSLSTFLVPQSIRDIWSIRLLPTTLVFDSSHKLTKRFDGENSDDFRFELLGMLTKYTSGPVD